MRIGILFCGGCSPTYDRVASRDRLAAALPEAVLEEAVAGETYDRVLVFDGCQSRCIREEEFGERAVLISSQADFDRVLEELTQAASRTARPQSFAPDGTPWVERNPFAIYNHIVMEYINEHESCFSVDMTEESLNKHGFAHGGILYSMADAAAGELAHMDGRSYVTQSGTLYFIGNQPRGRLIAKGRIGRRGRSISLVDVEITGEGGKLIARGTFTVFCTSEGRAKKE